MATYFWFCRGCLLRPVVASPFDKGGFEGDLILWRGIGVLGEGGAGRKRAGQSLARLIPARRGTNPCFFNQLLSTRFIPEKGTVFYIIFLKFCEV
jgi:hypothetical protein